MTAIHRSAVVGLVEWVPDSSEVRPELAEASAHLCIRRDEQRGVDVSGEALTASWWPSGDLSPVVQLGQRLGGGDELVADQVPAVLLLERLEIACRGVSVGESLLDVAVWGRVGRGGST